MAAFGTIVLLTLLCALSSPAIAQHRLAPARSWKSMPRLLRVQAAMPNGNGVRTPPSNPYQQGFRPRGPGPHRGDWLRRYGNLPPGEIERQLEQDKQFQSLPAERQQRLRQGLARFNSLPPEQKQRVLNRMELIEHLPPEQQQRVDGMFQQFRSLDPQRRRAVMQQLRYLRTLPPVQQQRVLESNGFRSGFNGQEQQIIRGLNEVGSQLPPGPRGPGY